MCDAKARSFRKVPEQCDDALTRSCSSVVQEQSVLRMRSTFECLRLLQKRMRNERREMRSHAQTKHNISRLNLFQHIDRAHQKCSTVNRIATTPDFAQTLFAKPRKHSLRRHAMRRRDSLPQMLESTRPLRAFVICSVLPSRVPRRNARACRDCH